MNADAVEEVGKTARGFFDVLREQPLSLALVVSNFVLLGYLFYSGTAIISQRRETVSLIVAWQKETDKLLQSCVSAEALDLMLKSLQSFTNRPRSELDKIIPLPQPPPSDADTPNTQQAGP